MRDGRDPSYDTIPPAEASSTSRRSSRRPIILIVVAMVGMVVIGARAFSSYGAGAQDRRPGDDWHGTLIEPARARPSFTLTDESGNPFDFSRDTGGRLTFLFFGYTSCSDICPITMGVLTSAIADLHGTAAQIVFVTTDPQRDTSERLTTWLANFPIDVVGLTGSVAELEAAQKAAGVSVAIPEAPDKHGNYDVGHSGSILVYTPDDLQHLVIPSQLRQVDYMDDIRRVVAEPTWNAIGAS